MEKIGLCKNRTVQRLLKKYIMGLFISRSGGTILYSFQIEPSINVQLISQFFSALKMFGKDNFGQIKRIIVEGTKIEMNIVSKHNLIATLFFRPGTVKDYLNNEASKALDMFYKQFRNSIDEGKSNHQIYLPFDDSMCLLIHEYLIRVGILDEVEVCTHMDRYFDN